MVEINFAGGCREIGGSAIEIESENGNNILLDYGIKVGEGNEKIPNFPHLKTKYKNFQYVVLSHAHADHSCGIPLLYSGTAQPNLLMTDVTRDLTNLLVKDTIKLSKYYLPFENQERMRMLKKISITNYNQRVMLNGIKVTLFDAGHIPGSSCIYLEINDKKFLYTGDINQIPTRLNDNCKSNFPPVDYLIIESTYALQDHPERMETENEFMNDINSTIEAGGNVLIPAFGVARSQEILLVLYYNGFNYPVTMDGMARASSYIFKDHPQFLKDYNFFEESLNKAKLISYSRNKTRERSDATKRSGAIIAPSGMLRGGTAMIYLQEMSEDENNSILLVSYQLPDSPGRKLLDTGSIFLKDLDEEITVKAKTKLYNFSSHSDSKHLWNLIDNINFNQGAKVFCVHGEEESCVKFADQIMDKYKNLEAHAPKAGEEFN
ncbi:MAG: MBL fold metallo-hydrolase [Candidatus Lokiarchaeota archaeon]|nr:MBL fold metallo-hydrolase [Candidatus Lokiarchaeota archaeon]